MAHWTCVLKPGQTAPRLYEARNEDDAETQAEKARDKSCEARVYRTATGSIHEAKRQLRGQIASDFGYLVGNSNFRSE